MPFCFIYYISINKNDNGSERVLECGLECDISMLVVGFYNCCLNFKNDDTEFPCPVLLRLKARILFEMENEANKIHAVSRTQQDR